MGIGSPLLWGGFLLFIIFMLALDLGVFHRTAHRIGMREALSWSLLWIALALLFNLGIYWGFGEQPALEFFTGYLIEKALSVDNLFVFLVIFKTFHTPSHLQHRVLFWGILGALIMRALFIAAGAALIASFHAILYLFGAFLVVTGLKLLLQRNRDLHPEQNPLVRLYKKIAPAVAEYHENHFVIVKDGRRYATLLLLVLVAVEASDIVFAVDSIPAIFAITHDPFIVFTSNIFAILGLRSLFFLLAGMLDRFSYLKVGLSLILVFVGMKMLMVDFYDLSISTSLTVVATLLGASVVASWLKPAR